MTETAPKAAKVQTAKDDVAPAGKPEACCRSKVWGFLWKVIDMRGIIEMEVGEATFTASSR
jgi:hypothetical protein